MNDLVAVPTVEQINLEHRLAHNKAGEALQHATNCGLMLLQVKASLSHGEWLPWLNAEIESGQLQVKARQARSYMQLASNWQRDANLIESPSIRAALELLSDQDPDEQQGTLIDVEAERKAREAAEAQAEAERKNRLEAEKRSANWHRQYREELDLRQQVENHAKALEKRIDGFNAPPEPLPVTIEKIVVPDDYEALKAKAAQLETELATNKAEQTRIVQSAIKAKLQGYQGEVDAMEAKKRHLEQQAKEYQDYLASLSGTAKQMEAQARSIEKTRQALVDLASELTDFYPVSPDLTGKMLALADMHSNAEKSLRMIFSPSALEKAA